MQNDPLRSRPGVVAVTQHFCCFFSSLPLLLATTSSTLILLSNEAHYSNIKKKTTAHWSTHAHTRTRCHLAAQRDIFCLLKMRSRHHHSRRFKAHRCSALHISRFFFVLISVVSHGPDLYGFKYIETA